MPLKTKAKFKLTRKSLRFRLTMFFVFALALLLVSLSVVISINLEEQVQTEFDTFLYNYVSGVAKDVRWDLYAGVSIYKKNLMAKEQILPFKFERSFVKVVDHNGKIIGQSGPFRGYSLTADKADFKTFKTKKALLRTLIIKGQQYRMITFPVVKDKGLLQLLIQVAVPTDFVRKRIQKNRRFFATIVPIALVIIFIAGYLFSGIALRPLNNIISHTRSMTASDLSSRLPDTAGEDELGVLTQNLNELFDRLDKSFRAQDEFVANASHQLKTPLAILKGEIDVFKSKPRSEEETQELVHKMNDELVHLTRIVSDLLILATLDSQKESLHLQPVLLDELVFESVSRIKPLAEKNGVSIELNVGPKSDADFNFLADPNLIKSMIQALLENAIKHSPAGESVKVLFSKRTDEVLIQLTNRGPVINKQDQERIFERFFRSSSEGSGVGLGLAISQEIAVAHGGNISVSSELESGTVFSVKIKKV